MTKMASSPMPTPSSDLFIGSGHPLHILVEPESVPLRTQVASVLRVGGAKLVKRPEDAQIIVVDATSDQGQLLVRDWSATKVCLDYKWVDACRVARRALLVEDNWGQHLAHARKRRDGSLPTPRSSPSNPTVPDGLPPVPATAESSVPPFDFGVGAGAAGPSTQSASARVTPSIIPPQSSYDAAQAQAQTMMQTLVSNPFAYQMLMAQMAAAGYPPPPGAWSSAGFEPMPPFGDTPPIYRIPGMTPRFPGIPLQGSPAPSAALLQVPQDPPQTIVPFALHASRSSSRRSSPPPPPPSPPPPPARKAPLATSKHASMSRKLPRKVGGSRAGPSRLARSRSMSSSPAPPLRRRERAASVIPPSEDEEDTYASVRKKRALSNHPPFETEEGEPLQIFVQHEDSFRTRKAVLESIRANGGIIAHAVEQADFVILVPSRAYEGMRERALAAGNVPLHVQFIHDSVAAGALQEPGDYTLSEEGTLASLIKQKKRECEGKGKGKERVVVKQEVRSVSPERMGERHSNQASASVKKLGKRSTKASFGREENARQRELRSPSPPRGPPSSTHQGKYRYTDEEKAWYEDYIRIAFRRSNYNKREISEMLFAKTPHHSASSWRKYISRTEEIYEKYEEEGAAWRAGVSPASYTKRRKIGHIH